MTPITITPTRYRDAHVRVTSPDGAIEHQLTSDPKPDSLYLSPSIQNDPPPLDNRPHHARLHPSGRMTTWLVGAVAAICAIAPPLATAKLPVAKDHTIVPNLSVGGVKLGMTKAQAVAKWGSKPRCVPPDNGVAECYWEPPGTFGDGGRIQVRGVRIIVVGVSISSSMKPSEIRALSQFKTAKGIHIGSSKSAAQRAYPGLQVPKGEAGSPFLRWCNVNCTWFGGLRTKVERISVAVRSPLGYR